MILYAEIALFAFVIFAFGWIGGLWDADRILRKKVEARVKRGASR